MLQLKISETKKTKIFVFLTQGLQSRSIFDVEQREKEKRTFKAFWARIKREFSSSAETLIIITILGLFSYGLTLFLKTRYFTDIKHSEL